MAQKVVYNAYNKTRKQLVASNLSVAVAQAGVTELLNVQTRGIKRLHIHFDVATNDIDAFQVSGLLHPDAAFDVMYSAAGDFTSPTGILVGASGDLTIVAAAASGWLILDVEGMYAVKIEASSGNVAGSAVSIYASGE